MLNRGLYTSDSSEWATPQDFYDRLNDEFHFTLDPCSTDENAKCDKHFTKEQDGLAQDWSGETVFCNPPYGRDIGLWCRKCYEHAAGGGTAVMLVHARTDTKWFHNWVYGKAELRFVRGRLHFNGSKWNAPFPSMVAIYRGGGNSMETKDPYLKAFESISDTVTKLAHIIDELARRTLTIREYEEFASVINVEEREEVMP